MLGGGTEIERLEEEEEEEEVEEEIPTQTLDGMKQEEDVDVDFEEGNLDEMALVHEEPQDPVPQVPVQQDVYEYVSRSLPIRKERRVHTCDRCGKDFPTPSKLQRHNLTHTGERPFACDLCARGFTQLSHLKNHQKFSHNPNRPTVKVEASTSSGASSATKAASLLSLKLTAPRSLGPDPDIAEEGEVDVDDSTYMSGKGSEGGDSEDTSNHATATVSNWMEMKKYESP